MNVCLRVLCLFVYLTTHAYAVGEPLVVGITQFTPPFVMQDADKKTYGFDIEMMNFICKALQKTCVYRVMGFDELIPSVISKKVDVAVSSLTITAERTKKVNFTLPYLLSYSRFLTKHTDNPTDFNLDQLTGKKIGIRAGSVFADQINHLGIKDPVIREYQQIDELLEALGSDQVDYVLLDSPTTNYWVANSGQTFTKVGPAFMYGYGLGIASTPESLADINKALLQFQASKEYKTNFDQYIVQF